MPYTLCVARRAYTGTGMTSDIQPAHTHCLQPDSDGGSPLQWTDLGWCCGAQTYLTPVKWRPPFVWERFNTEITFTDAESTGITDLERAFITKWRTRVGTALAACLHAPGACDACRAHHP